jgi:succinate dehydrogenase / fumarate reductase, cytochrome b subunit
MLIKKLFAFLTEFPDNFNWEMACFVGQRLSGILLTIYLCAHIIVISSATYKPEHFTQIMEMMHKSVWVFLEMLLFFGVIAHMLNGLRITICDFFGLTKSQKSLIAVIAVIGFFVVGIGVLVMGNNFLNHHI